MHKMRKMEKSVTRKITHLEIDGRHEYFGSPASLYAKYSAEELGITQGALNNYFYKLKDDEEQIYVNKFCKIRKGPLYVKPSTRGRKHDNEKEEPLVQ